jgi:hypothetical protein
MVKVSLQATVDETRQLIITVPDEIPAGEVTITIAPKPALTREEARDILRRAGGWLNSMSQSRKKSCR